MLNSCASLGTKFSKSGNDNSTPWNAEMEVGQVLHRANRHVLTVCTPAGFSCSGTEERACQCHCRIQSFMTSKRP
jgi:hypothetical protein